MEGITGDDLLHGKSRALLHRSNWGQRIDGGALGSPQLAAWGAGEDVVVVKLGEVLGAVA